MTEPKLNVVIIMADQQRADFSQAEGFALDVCPALDRMGREGTRFGRAYTASPVCMPARISMLTGRFPSVHGIRGNFDPEGARYTEDLLDVLGHAGYHTAIIGKNHTYRSYSDWHFQRNYGNQYGPARSEYAPEDELLRAFLTELNHGVATEPTPAPVQCQYPYRAVDDAIQYVDAHREEPFFLELSFAEPHNPFHVPEPYWDMFPPEELPDRLAGPESLAQKGYAWVYEDQLIEHYRPNHDSLWRRYRSNYCGMIRLIDDQVARFLDHIEQTGLAERTVVVYTSDHGEFTGDYGLQRKGVSVHDDLMRVPMIWRGPGVVAREFHPAHVSLVDILPTICEVIGQPIPVGVQGRSLWPLLTGQNYSETEFACIYGEHGAGGLGWDETDEAPYDAPNFFIGEPDAPNVTFQELNCLTMSGKRRMLRKGDWKLVMDLRWGGELYNLVKDPAELENLYDDAECAAIRAELMEDLLRWTIRVSDDLPRRRYKAKVGEHNWEW